MRRRWKRRLVWAAILLGLAVLAIPATLADAAAALRRKRRLVVRKLVALATLGDWRPRYRVQLEE